MKKIDSNKKLIIISLLILIVIFIGISFALAKMTLRGDKSITLIAKNLQLNYTEGTSTITLTKVAPQEDSDGLKNTPYTFTLKNTGTRTITYDVYLDDDSDCTDCATFTHSFLSYDLKKDGTSVSNGKLSTSSNKLGSYSIAGNTTQSFEFRLWLNLDATNDVMAKSFYSRIRVEATEQVD